jgi:hypothetical protein
VQIVLPAFLFLALTVIRETPQFLFYEKMAKNVKAAKNKK